MGRAGLEPATMRLLSPSLRCVGEVVSQYPLQGPGSTLVPRVPSRADIRPVRVSLHLHCRRPERNRWVVRKTPAGRGLGRRRLCGGRADYAALRSSPSSSCRPLRCWAKVWARREARSPVGVGAVAAEPLGQSGVHHTGLRERRCRFDTGLVGERMGQPLDRQELRTFSHRVDQAHRIGTQRRMIQFAADDEQWRAPPAMLSARVMKSRLSTAREESSSYW